ncbi:ATP-dependent helicase [Microvirga sp. BT688]|uniref:ATP-dependent helicase n=1 Tax=Microvirga sp. TaxID=1873136 RepID=UPI0016858994|nr:ATP-dependent helicase [Microvirga sp.]MBD2745844.1 ATP-dependent helicase [Microvirga sp.]
MPDLASTISADSSLQSVLTQGLNTQQKWAVEEFGRPLLVLSSSGTGKTHVLATKFIYAVQVLGFKPEEIMAVTFTRKAAHELKDRIGNKIKTDLDNLYVGTFHSLSSRMLRIHQAIHTGEKPFTIVEPEEIKMTLTGILASLDGFANSSSSREIDKRINGLLKTIDAAKNIGAALSHAAGSSWVKSAPGLSREDADILAQYDRTMRENRCLDYNDLILDFVRLTGANPIVARSWKKKFKLVLVDEYQDTNPVQERWLQIFTENGSNLACFGDDDQAVYGWRHATVDNILTFEKRYPGSVVIKLGINYRCPEQIVRKAGKLISANQKRHAKTVKSGKAAQGDVVSISCNGPGGMLNQALMLVQSVAKAPPKDITVLARTNSDADEVAQFLLRHGVNVFRFNPDADSSPQLQTFLAWLRLLANEQDSPAATKIMTSLAGLGTAQAVWRAARMESLPVMQWLSKRADNGTLKHEGLSRLVDTYRALRSATMISSTSEMVELALSYTDLDKDLEALNSARRSRFFRQYMAISEHARRVEDLATVIATAQTDIADVAGRPANAVAVSTMHAMKGLESPIVISPGWSKGKFPSGFDKGDEIDEARRLAFVTVTRASARCYLLWESQLGPSPFLSEMGLA